MVRRHPEAVRWRGAIYRTASVVDFAQSVATSLFRWMADTRVAKQDVLSHLEKLYNAPDSRSTRSRDSSAPISAELSAQIAQYFSLLASNNVNWGDFLPVLVEKLNAGPGGHYEWRERGSKEYLVKRENKPALRAPARGKKFSRYVLIGVWVVTKNAKSSTLIRLRNALKRRGGGFFYHNQANDNHSYGGFALVMTHVAEDAGEEIRDFCRLLHEDDGADFHLSAVSLEGLSVPRPIQNSDFYKMHSIHDINFNDLYTLPEVVNGQTPDPKYGELPRRLRGSLA